MSWKLKTGDILRFADEAEDEPEDELVGGGREADADDTGEAPEADIDKLRSKHDKELAALRKELSDLQRKQDEGAGVSAATQAYNAAMGEVNAAFADLKAETDATKLKAALDTRLKTLAHNYGLARSAQVQIASSAKSNLAEALAVDIAAQAGGDKNSYKTAILKGNSEAEMRLLAANLRLEVAKTRRGKSEGGKAAPRVDKGTGSTARTNLLDELVDIDVTTPEGLKKWKENEKRFAKAISSSSG